MRVLASADLHGKQPVYEWLARMASIHQVEAVVLGGDLLGCPDGFETPEAAQEWEGQQLSEFLAAMGLPILYIMGNDDLVELNPTCDRLQSMNGRRIQVGACSFVGYQYSLPFMGGTFEKPEEGIKIDLSTLDHLVSSKTVFVSHSPALGILDPGVGDVQIGSRSLKEFLERHSCYVHIHGHSHGGFGRHGSHFNVASAGRRRAMILNLETLEHQIIRDE